ncbi:hypothetical protein HDU76_001870 [Blyttiomyces sp. JEL0837]|nr:hypothetical protein HDU76_001870 [Blyttiomyces sp. JEL0837]
MQSSNTNSKLQITHLPVEVLDHILAFVGPKPSNLAPCLTVCHRFNDSAKRAFSSISFESVEQRRRFAKLVSEGGYNDFEEDLQDTDDQGIQNGRHLHHHQQRANQCLSPTRALHSSVLDLTAVSFTLQDLRFIEHSNPSSPRRTGSPAFGAPFEGNDGNLAHIQVNEQVMRHDNLLSTSPGIPPTNSTLPYRKSNLGLRVRSLDFGLRPISPPPQTLPTPVASTSTSTSTSSTPTTTSPLAQLQHPASPSSQTPSENTRVPYGTKWDHRFITDELGPILRGCPDLKALNLSGCQIRDTALSEALSSLGGGLKVLDLSHSSIRGSGIESVGKTCGDGLKWLNVSGLFRFRRNSPSNIIRLVESCPSLQEIVAADCPDIDEETWLQCLELNPDLKISTARGRQQGFGSGRRLAGRTATDENELDDDEAEEGLSSHSISSTRWGGFGQGRGCRSLDVLNGLSETVMFREVSIEDE